MRDPLVPEEFQLLSAVLETEDTFTLTLKPASGRSEFNFAPGQFNMLYVFGAGEVPISISGDADRNDLCIHTIRAVGPTTALLKNLKPGDAVGLRGPFGSPWPVAQAEGKDVLLIAGGIGLAPLRPVIYHVLNHRDQFGRLTIVYGARTPRDLLYRDEFMRWAEQDRVQAEITVDSADATWKGQVGVVLKLIPGAEVDPLHCIAMLCGPEIMMRFTVSELEKMGISDDRIFLSMERNMKCAIGLCGHCQYGSDFVCKDGPVFPYEHVRTRFYRKEF
jgi:NAD(P)H-flavin reductase